MVDSEHDSQDRIASDSDGWMMYYLNCKMSLMFPVPCSQPQHNSNSM